MTPAQFAAELSSVADESLLRTNPVWCIDKLVGHWSKRDRDWLHLPRRLVRLLSKLDEAGIHLPASAVGRWSEVASSRHQGRSSGENLPKPGVVGLIVDIVCRDAWIVPLVAERASEWAADATLPFRPGTVLRDLLMSLIDSLNLGRNGLPERFAFSVGDALGRRSDGLSMHVAGLLSVIRAANECPAELDRACAVVQPDVGRLVAVGGIRQKLQAFVRECGRGTLLVRANGCVEAAEFDEHFDHVWKVDSLADLARHLDGYEWLAPFLTADPLDVIETNVVRDCVRRLERIEYRYAEALGLVERVEGCGFASTVPKAVQREFRSSRIDLLRHLGDYTRSAELASVEYRRAYETTAASWDDRAEAAVNYAAAFYAPHRFDEMRLILTPWRNELIDEPLRVRPLTRVKVFNTLGRALAALGEEGWETSFLDSAVVLQEIEPNDLPRTWCYLAQGYLRADRTDDALDLLRRIESHPGLDDPSRWFLRYYQADAARRQGRLFTDPRMEAETTSCRVGHPFGFYLQATARQPGRSAGEAIERFRRAREFFDRDHPQSEGRNIQRFLSDCVSLSEAAWAEDEDVWATRLVALHEYLTDVPGLGFREYYASHLPDRGTPPCRGAAERLLARVPFF